jgi:poly(A) polymerase
MKIKNSHSPRIQGSTATTHDLDLEADSRPHAPRENAIQNLKSIPIKPSTAVPKPVIQACETLRQAGYDALLAGGCVRDLILSRTPKDWDIVTSAPAEKIKTLFPDHLDVGVKFGVFKLPPTETRQGVVHIDIAIFRKDGPYSDARHPDSVSTGDPESDAMRRDFTVNALFWDPATQKILDYVDGYKDIGGKLLRAVGKPVERFQEDALRTLRAVRFSAQLGFKLDTDTQRALKDGRDLLRKISRERIREEIFRMLASEKAVHGIRNMINAGLWEPVFGVRKISFPSDLASYRAAH